MRLLGPEVLEVYGGTLAERPPVAPAVVPGDARRARRARVRRQGHGRHRLPRRRGDRHRADRPAGGDPRAAATTTGTRSRRGCTRSNTGCCREPCGPPVEGGSGWTGGTCLDRGLPVTDVRRRSGARCSRSSTRPASSSLAEALVSSGSTLVSSGGTAQALRDAGIARHTRRGGDGVPRDARRTREDAAPARYTAGCSRTGAGPSMSSSWRSTASNRSICSSSNLYPFRETVASGADRRRGDREDRHRRAGDGARGGQELRVGGRDGGSRAGTRSCSTNSASRAGSRADPRRPGRRGVRAHGRLRRGSGGLVRGRAGRGRRAAGVRGAAAARRSATCGTARTRTSGVRCIGSRPVPACSAARGYCRARRCRSTIGWTSTPRSTSWRRLPEPACVIVKHNNPCGVAVKEDPAEAYRRAFACDTVSAFGGIVAFNTMVDDGCRGGDGRRVHRGRDRAVVHRRCADGIRRASEPPGGRAPRSPHRSDWTSGRSPAAPWCRIGTSRPRRGADWKVVSSREPTAREWADLAFAWTIAWRVKSNAIVFAKDGATVGIGAGQMSRVDAAMDRGAQGRWACHRSRDGLRRLLPFPGRAGGRRRRGLHGGDPSRRVEGRRRHAGRCRGARHGGRDHGPPPLPSLSSVGLGTAR